LTRRRHQEAAARVRNLIRNRTWQWGKRVLRDELSADRESRRHELFTTLHCTRRGPARLSGQGHTIEFSPETCETLPRGKKRSRCCLRARGKRAMAYWLFKKSYPLQLLPTWNGNGEAWTDQQQPGPKEPPPGRPPVIAISIITPDGTAVVGEMRAWRPGEGRCKRQTQGGWPSGSGGTALTYPVSLDGSKQIRCWPTGPGAAASNVGHVCDRRAMEACARTWPETGKCPCESCTFSPGGLSASQRRKPPETLEYNMARRNGESEVGGRVAVGRRPIVPGRLD